MDMDKKYKTEALFTKTVNRYLKGLVKSGYPIHFDKIANRNKKGVADFVCCIKGLYVGLELKKIDGEVSAHQLIAKKKVSEAFGIYKICWTLRDIEECIEIALNR